MGGNSDRSIVAIVMTEDLARASRPRRRPSAGKAQVVSREGPDGSVRYQLRRLARPDGYASVHGLSITPWVPVPNNPSALHAIRAIQKRGGYIPEGTTRRDGFDALLVEGWTVFQVLEGRLYSRLKQPIEGVPGSASTTDTDPLGASGPSGPSGPSVLKQVCGACWFWMPTNSMRTTQVGVDIGHLQEVRVCQHCLNEGVITRTTAKGYIAVIARDPL